MREGEIVVGGVRGIKIGSGRGERGTERGSERGSGRGEREGV